ncbi:aminoglycoside phosphotransferase family protein [Deinococcus radiophilus]|uniref:aminoglycoside phosphotransferase family protein n=1 Tax=Deinococcus radiophilus TaxID=32062 RepID=UPI003606DE49
MRLPRTEDASGQILKDWIWLPRLAPHLPCSISQPLELGQPSREYPLPWGIYRWLPGQTPQPGQDLRRVAVDLADFIRTLQAIDTAGAPRAGDENFGRGVPLIERDEYMRESIAQLPEDVDRAAVTSFWEAALTAPPWSGPPVWIHGDLQAGNPLVADGRLSAVIDFGTLAVGDPACELAVAWVLLDAPARAEFMNALKFSAADWQRARGWALSIAVIALPYYLHRSPAIAAASRRTIAEVLRPDGPG